MDRWGINSLSLWCSTTVVFILYHVHFTYARVQGVIFGRWHVRSYCWPMIALVCYGRTVPVPASTHRAGICIFYGFDDSVISENLLCNYIEFLIRSFSSLQTVKNYVSGVATLQRCRGLPLSVFQSVKVKNMWRAASLTVRTMPLPTLALTKGELRSLILATGVFGSNFLDV